jgi:heme/copper-type cytochrome/quinol oxidase subunit 2
MHERFAISQHLIGAEARLVLCNLLLGFIMLAPEYSDACMAERESTLPDAVVAPDPGAAVRTVPPCFIEITGNDHRWQARYQCAGGQWAMAGNRQIGEAIHVPIGAPTVIVLKSTDFVYLFAVPQLGLREIAVPDLEFRIEFRPLESGTFSIAGQRLCAGPSAVLPGELVVESLEKFRAWLHETAQGTE